MPSAEGGEVNLCGPCSGATTRQAPHTFGDETPIPISPLASYCLIPTLTMSALPCLPPEILVRVFAHTGNQERVNIARCSHTFYEAVTPLLYEHITLRHHEELEEYYCELTTPSVEVQLRSLVTTLLSKPTELAPHVKRLTLKGHFSSETPWRFM